MHPCHLKFIKYCKTLHLFLETIPSFSGRGFNFPRKTANFLKKTSVFRIRPPSFQKSPMMNFQNGAGRFSETAATFFHMSPIDNPLYATEYPLNAPVAHKKFRNSGFGNDCFATVKIGKISRTAKPSAGIFLTPAGDCPGNSKKIAVPKKHGTATPYKKPC